MVRLFFKCVTVFSAFHLFSSSTLAGTARLINGKPVDPGTYKEVISINTNGSGCTATIVGPKVIITAAHCAVTGATAKFKVDGVEYSAVMARSSLYPSQDHDVALGVVNTEIPNIKPFSVGGKANKGDAITLLGYGCINVGGGGGNDGILRIGSSVIVDFSEFDMVSRMAGGAALCYGDSGGPAFISDGGKQKLLGINSKGNIKDTNYNTRTDVPESVSFIKEFASKNAVTICGVNSECGSGPPPTPPTCTMAASPSTVQLGKTLVVTLLLTSGEATTGTINGQTVSVPNGQISITPTNVGMFTASGTVTGSAGTGSCKVDYKVENENPQPGAPTCTLAAIPSSIKLGESLTLEISTAGQVSSASIEGTPVSFPVGKKIITPASKGSYTANASVSGPGGTGSCWASYLVDEGAQPGTPNFAVVPSYCGENILAQTQVRKVCLSIVKKDATVPDLKIPEVLMLTYTDQSYEVLPIISRRIRQQGPGEVQMQEDLTLFANASIQAETFQVLDTRLALLTKTPGKRDIPVSVEGRSAKGQYFIVEKLSPFNVSE